MKLDAKRPDVVKQLKTDIKRTNTRISAIAKEYGINSPVYKESIKGYENGQFAGFTHMTKSGVLQINANLGTQYGKSDKPTNLPQRQLLRSQFAKMPTLTSIKSRAAEEVGYDLKKFSKLSKQKQKELTENIYRIREDFEAKKQEFYNLYSEKSQKELMKDMFSEGAKEYDDLEEYADMMDFFINHVDNYDPIEKEFVFTDNDLISPDDIPDFVKYHIE